MPVLVDYRCTQCRRMDAHWAPSPPPPARACPACGSPARRVFGFAVGGKASQSGTGAATGAPGGAPSCRGNPDVPLLCHVDPSAAAGWVARYRQDNRALEQHLKRTEESPAPAPPPQHGHQHGHHHGHA